MTRREGESDRTWFRIDRFYCSNGKWYFSSRNYQNHGPFDTRSDAETELLFFMRAKGYISATDSFGSLEEAIASFG